MDENMTIYGDGFPNFGPIEEATPKKYTIILSNGHEIGDLTLNGNNFVSKVPITKDMFTNGLSPVIISDGENVEKHEYMDLLQITTMDSDYLFVLLDVSPEERAQRKLRSDLDYVMMMIL